jgi:gamma-carbonic anhydrase
MNESLLKRFLLDQTRPVVPASAYVAPGAVLLGDARLGEQASLWFGSVLRADINRIEVGAQSNVQDGSVLHVSDDCPCVLGERVSVGHRAVVHACTVGDEVLVGMGAILLDGAVIGARSIVAAGALVPKGLQVPEGSLVLGTPARVVRALTAGERAANARLALKYVELARRYREMAGTVPGA